MHRALIILLAVSSAAAAKLPELDAVYYGLLSHNGGQPLSPASSGDVLVIARFNGVTIGQTSVAAGSPAFVLKLPRDDGADPRLTGTVRGGERVRIYLHSNGLNAEYEALESASVGGLSVSTVKGGVVAQNFSVSQNLVPVSPLVAWLVSHGLPADSAALDTFGNGITNAAKYAADIDPNDPTARFVILAVTRSGGNNFVKFGPVRPNRVYTVWSSPTLGSNDWTSVGQVTPGVTSDYFLFGHQSPASSCCFYKLQVTAP